MELSEQKPVGLTGRYINALFELCSEKKVIDEVVSDFNNLQEHYLSNPEISQLISSPTIGKVKQTKLIVEILKKAKANKVTINFCGVLSKNGRVSLLNKIVEEFLREVSRRNGELNVEVESAYELDQSKKSIIEKQISKNTGREKILLRTNVDKSLIGGLVIKIGSKMIDNSIKTKLKNLELAMKGES